MKVHMPDGRELVAELRDISKIRDDLWQIKITVPELSMQHNLYLSLNDEEIERIRRGK